MAIIHSVDAKTMSQVETLALEKMASYSGCHDHFHIMRVMNNAKLIMNRLAEYVEDDMDESIVSLICLLHDVGDRKLINQPEDDYSIAAEIMEQCGIEKETQQKVLDNMKKLGFASDNGKMENWEGMIAQDADRLDALGAIGIARCFAYGGMKHRPLWNPDQAPADLSNKEDYKKHHDGNSLNHFYEKLFLLKDMMNTEAGAEIALERHRYMMEYVERFKGEFFGEK